MASTNKTTNYNLSQFIGSDKPAWLTDYNQDMSKIDTGIHSAQTTATGADGKADANATNIGDLGYLSTANKNNLVSAINEVDGNADTAQNTANNAATTANTAASNIAKFNLTNKNELTVSTNTGVLSSSSHLYIAKDSTGSVFKLYGRVSIESLNGITGNLSITISDSGLRPTQDYDIASAVLVIQEYSNSDYVFVRPRSVHIGTDGSVTVSNFPINLDGVVKIVNLDFLPCLYFNSDFEDAPQN